MPTATEERITNARARLEKSIEAGGKDANELVRDYILTDVNALPAEERLKYLGRLAQAGYKFNENKGEEKKKRL